MIDQASANSERRLDIQRILVPHDFGVLAQAALSLALTWAERFGASITILHVYEAPTFDMHEGQIVSYEFEAIIQREARIALDELAARPRPETVDVDTMLRRGTPWSEIEAVAKELKSQLIVMGTHGRRGIARALIGSVAERIVRTAPCPVLTVHAV